VSNVNLAVKHAGEVHGKLVPENVRHRTAVEHHLDKQQQSMRVSGQLRMSAVTAALPALAAVCCGSTQLPIFGGLPAQVDWLGLRVGGHPALSLHSSDEPGELSQ